MLFNVRKLLVIRSLIHQNKTQLNSVLLEYIFIMFMSTFLLLDTFYNLYQYSNWTRSDLCLEYVQFMAGVYSFGFIIHAGQPHNKCGPFGCGSGGELPLRAALHILQHDTTQGGASLGFGQSVSPWACTATTIATIEMKIKKFFILSGCSAQRWIKTLHRKQDLNKRMALNSVSTSLLYPFFSLISILYLTITSIFG